VSVIVLGADPQEERKQLRKVGSLREFLQDRYLPYVRTNKRSWKTDEGYIRIYILPSLGRRRLDEIKADHINELLLSMRQSGCANATCNRALIILRYAYNLAKKWKIPGTKENPTAGIATLRLPRLLVSGFSAQTKPTD
jgi:site-specific recombinase XerD